MRASAVVKCQSAEACLLLRAICHAATCLVRLSLSGMRREALAGQHAEFAFSHVQPTAVLGRIVPFEPPLDEAAGLLGREGFIERGRLVGVEIVLHEHDLAGLRKVRVRITRLSIWA